MGYSPKMITHVTLRSAFIRQFEEYANSKDNDILYNFVYATYPSTSLRLHEECYCLIENSIKKDEIIKEITVKINNYFVENEASENLIKCSHDFAVYFYSNASASYKKRQEEQPIIHFRNQ